MTPEQTAAQQDHAQRIREQTEARRAEASSSPDQRAADELRALKSEVDALKALFASVNITGNGCTVSGKFPTLTITVPKPNWKGFATVDCDADPPTLNITLTGG